MTQKGSGEKNIIAVDVGATHMRIGFVGSDFAIRDMYRISTPSTWSSEEDVIHGITSFIQSFVDQYECEDYSLGVSVPGATDTKKGSFRSRNLGFEGEVCLRGRLRETFGREVHVFNDANIAAYGVRYMECPDAHSMAYITLSTGVGGGIIVDGRLLEGHNGRACNVGRIPIRILDSVYDWEKCVSGKNIVQFFGRWCTYNKNACALPHDAKNIFDRARDNDPIMRQFLEDIKMINIQAIQAIVSICAPQYIYFGGSVGACNEEYVIDPLIASAKLFPRHYAVELGMTRLGDEVSLVGIGVYLKMYCK